MSVRYGWRLRLGMIIPAVNTEAEPQIEAMLPEGVTLHTTRLRMIEDTPDQLLSLTERIEEGAALLGRCRGRPHPLPLHRGHDLLARHGAERSASASWRRPAFPSR